MSSDTGIPSLREKMLRHRNSLLTPEFPLLRINLPNLVTLREVLMEDGLF